MNTPPVTILGTGAHPRSKKKQRLLPPPLAAAGQTNPPFIVPTSRRIVKRIFVHRSRTRTFSARRLTNLPRTTILEQKGGADTWHYAMNGKKPAKDSATPSATSASRLSARSKPAWTRPTTGPAATTQNLRKLPRRKKLRRRNKSPAAV